MAKRAISVTLESGNLTWLKGRAGATGASVSDLLDQIVSAARQDGGVGPSRSVVGTIDIDSSDPLLDNADAIVRSAFEASLGRPLRVAESRAAYRGVRKGARRRRA